MGWLLVLVASAFEIGFTTSLKASDGLTRLWPSCAFVVCAVLSFYFLHRALGYLPLGTAYAVWTGIGAFGTTLIGILAFGDPAGAARLAFLTLLVVSVLGLKLVSG